MADKKDYEVGYGKPPKATRFKTGQSGNPRGRPRKKPETLSSLLEKEAIEKIVLVENGNRRKVTKLEALIKRLWNDALAGNPRARDFLYKQLSSQALDKIDRQTENIEAAKSLDAKLARLAQACEEEEKKKAEAVSDRDDIRKKLLSESDEEDLAFPKESKA